jgi:opacity protein-like surface antigen
MGFWVSSPWVRDCLLIRKKGKKMTVKKLALLGLASAATLGMSISMAGGPATCAPAPQMSGVYVGVGVGGSYNNSLRFDTNSISSTRPYQMGPVTITGFTNSSFNHSPWAWTVDALIGYQFNNNWALQFGYIWNQDQKATGTLTASAPAITGQVTTFKLQTYNLYLGLKGMLPLWNDLSAYMMVGPAWTHIKQSNNYATTADTSSSDSFWSPMGAVGVAWNLSSGFSLNLQYMYIMSDIATSNASSLKGWYDGTQRITVGANYLFAM